MNIEFERILRILDRFAAGDASDEDKKVFGIWLKTADTSDYKKALDYYQSLLNEVVVTEPYSLDSLAAIEKRIDQYEEGRSIRLKRLRLPVLKAAAAVILVALITLLYKSFNPSEGRRPDHVTDITPGGNKAVLRLSDGSVIALDSAGKGILAHQGSTSILKSGGGQLTYNTRSSGTYKSSELMYNILSTPRGGQYRLLLPDGTKVWLNAASLIRFPADFTGKERKVSISGEVYFEVARNRKMPFLVEAGGVLVRVLGTNFNVKAYPDDEIIQTSLTEGLVKLQSGTASVELKPGYKASIPLKGREFSVAPADLKVDLAWKDGVFRFDNADMKDVLKDISRWYDVEIIMDERVSSHAFVGEIDRHSNLSEVLLILEAGGEVKFDIQGKKLIVKPA